MARRARIALSVFFGLATVARDMREIEHTLAIANPVDQVLEQIDCAGGAIVHSAQNVRQALPGD